MKNIFILASLIGISLISFYGGYLFNRISPTEEPRNVTVVNKPELIGDIDLKKLNPNDEVYTTDVDVYTKDKWSPENYVVIPRKIDQPQYPAQIGTITKDKLPIANNEYLYLTCSKINENAKVPPYWGKCELKLNDNYIIDTNVRSEVICDNYQKQTNCNEKVGLVVYENEITKDLYLFLSSAESIGSSYTFSSHILRKEDGNNLPFDYREFISETNITRGGMDTENFYLAYTDKTKKEFKLVSYFYDPSMQSISSLYYEWKLTKNRWLLDRKIASVKD